LIFIVNFIQQSIVSSTHPQKIKTKKIQMYLFKFIFWHKYKYVIFFLWMQLYMEYLVWYPCMCILLQVLLRHSPPVKQCTTETFEIYSGCMQGKICSMYFVRIGKDGWKPESAIISYGDYPPATFNFNYFIPEGTPSGFNYC